jgi:hypothetical protein
MYILERYLKVADILKSLDSHALTVLSVLLEYYRFLDALDIKINQACDADWKDKVSENLSDNCSHYLLFYFFFPKDGQS